MDDTQLEKIIDRRVQARLRTDRDYLFAENAEVAALAERKVTLQEELAVLLAAPFANEHLIEDLQRELLETTRELRDA
jgi:hypothetical protein